MSSIVLMVHTHAAPTESDYTALAKESFINRIILNHLNNLSPIHCRSHFPCITYKSISPRDTHRDILL